MLNRTVAPPIHDAVSFNFSLPPCNKVISTNNMPVYWLNAGTQDVVQIEWIFKAGLWQESQTALAQAVASLLKNGSKNYTALQLNEALEFYGAAFNVSANNDYTVITLHTLTKHLAVMLPVIKEIIIDATFPEEELQIYKQNAQQRLNLNLRKSDFVSNRHIDAYLFGRQHPYGKYTEAADLLALNSDALRKFHRDYYHSANCMLLVAGKIDDSHISLIDSFFGKEHWGTSGAALQEPAYTIQPAAEKHYRITNDENGVQGAIRIARDFPNRKHPDFSPMIVLNTIFGGYFGSRLMTNIREEKGFTYGISSQIYNYKNEGALLIATEAGKDVCEQAVTEVYKEMDLLCNELVDDEELLLVKNYLLGSILGDLDGPFSIMQRWKNIILNELPFDQFEKNIEVYKSITPEQLLELARKYLRKEDYYELIVV
jgi:zinc protease